MQELQQLYQEIILDHNRHPRNFGKLAGYTHSECGYNPVCGDEVRLYAKITEDGLISRVMFEGEGCAVSRASASLLTEYLKNQSMKSVMKNITPIMESLKRPENNFIESTDLAPLTGVKGFPARINCVLLPWQTLARMLPASTCAEERP